MAKKLLEQLNLGAPVAPDIFPLRGTSCGSPARATLVGQRLKNTGGFAFPTLPFGRTSQRGGGRVKQTATGGGERRIDAGVNGLEQGAPGARQ